MTTTLTELPEIEYKSVKLENINLRVVRSSKQKRSIRMSIEGQPVEYTERFSTSLAMNLGFPKSVFNLFEPDEVFQRIHERTQIEKLSIALHHKKDGNLTKIIALGTSLNPRPVVTTETIDKLHEVCAPIERSYNNGIIQSTYEMKMGKSLNIRGNDFNARFVLETPIDGFGPSSAYLALLRLICKNGMVAISPAFRTRLAMSNKAGVDNIKLLRRFCETFSCDEGFDVLGQRLQSAASSPASLDEILKLHNVLSQFHEFDIVRELESSSNLQRYGIISLVSLNEKQRRICPTNNTVYDLMNIATEAATHKVSDPRCTNSLHAYVGTLLSHPYDLEGTLSGSEEPQDIFLANHISRN